MKQELLQEIASYWGTRAEGYSEVNEKELAGSQREAWLHVLEEQFPEKKKEEMKILDIGTGPGFFPMILSEAGYTVTAVDYTEEMLEKAKENLGKYTKYGLERVTLQRMDAQNLEFADETFDVVISRNLTWNLEEPGKAYAEWMRVLKKGGILLNFDADYASNVRNQNTSASHISDTEVYGHCGVTPELEQENASITLSMPMSRKQRPYWDQEFLENIGFSRSGYDPSVGQNILKEHDLKDAPMFLVWGVR